MENIIKVSGLGFEMEFDLKDIINGGIKEFYNSEDLDSPFCYIYPDRDTYTNNRRSEKYAKTLRELYSIDDMDCYNSLFIDIPNVNCTVIRCSYIIDVLRFLTYKELVSCGIVYSKDLCNLNSTDLKMCTRQTDVLEPSQVMKVYKALDDRYGNLIDNNRLNHVGTAPYWHTGFNVFMCMQKCLNLYVAKHLNLPIKRTQGSYLYCDKSVGRFSSTYNIVLEFNGVKSIQKVVVTSDNMVTTGSDKDIHSLHDSVIKSHVGDASKHTVKTNFFSE